MLGNLRKDAKNRGCWSALLYPKVAPAWYRKLVGGLNSGDVHQQPMPPGSLLLLGFVSMAVPDLEPTDIYWVKSGVGAGRSLKQKTGEEIRVNIGPSQMRFPLAAGAPAQRWPGEITIWVDDIRQTTDHFNMLGNTLGTDIVNEYQQAEAGGEFLLKLKDPFRRSWIKVTEAPVGFSEQIRSLGHDVSQGDEQYPPKVFNPVAIADLTVFVTSREVMLGTVRFYNHYMLVPMKGAGPTEYKVQLHLGPGQGLHQTITFRQDPGSSFTEIGSICVYIAEKDKFVRGFARCKAAGLLTGTALDLHEAERRLEFEIKCIQDPESKAMLIPLQHTVRYCDHPEWPLGRKSFYNP